MRKILHIDMDAFYASIEERDHPELRGKPMAVGGSSGRGVLTTANYEARKFGCRSAMPAFKARALCPHLIFMPVRFEAYREASAQVRRVFSRFTDKIEPLSLDEAYLDISHWETSAAAVAREIRAQIHEETQLTASAGIASNKMLAKIASDWQKPNGQFEVAEGEVEEFMRRLPVGKLWGVGKKMQEKLVALGIETCGDMQAFDKVAMGQRFGQWGLALYDLCRGRDSREVRPNRIRKSLSKERTFSENMTDIESLQAAMRRILEAVQEELMRKASDREIRSLVVKMKFADFQRTTAERAGSSVDEPVFLELLDEAWSRGKGRAVRLLGVGVRFRNPEVGEQLEMWEDPIG